MRNYLLLCSKYVCLAAKKQLIRDDIDILHPQLKLIDASLAVKNCTVGLE
jgi:hypothetical protein